MPLYISFFAFLSLNFLYIFIWNKNFKGTPTGIGVFLLIPLVYYCVNQSVHFAIIISLVLCSLIYYLDDLVKINYKIRIGLQIFVALIIFYLFRETININYLPLIIFLFFGIINSFNFQDGQDLNIFVILFLIFFLFYLYSNQKIIENTSMLILFYLISFGIFNKKPSKLYFGDSGCYVATIIIFTFCIVEFTNIFLIKSIVAILLFPLTDITVVIIYRIFNKENLLTRNYHHIYQKLYKKTKYYIYLLPNIFFAGVNFYFSQYLYLDIKNIFFVIFFNALNCLILHFFVNKFFYNEN